MRVSLVGVGLNLALNLTLVWRLEEAGLGLATAITAVFQLGWLAVSLASRMGSWPRREMLGSAARAAAAGAAMVCVTLGVTAGLRGLAPSIGAIPLLLGQVVAGVASYGGVAWLLRCRELRELMSRLGA
jgi:putative peptidoglycan lipid II flippase